LTLTHGQLNFKA